MAGLGRVLDCAGNRVKKGLREEKMQVGDPGETKGCEVVSLRWSHSYGLGASEEPTGLPARALKRALCPRKMREVGGGCVGERPS